jgi:hypothetical protein
MANSFSPSTLDGITTSPTPVANSSSNMSGMLSGLTDNINKMLENNYLRMFIFVTAAVYAGYTLTPVPKRLDNLFAKSNLFKYMVLFFVAVSMLHPLDNTKLTICLIVPVLVLGLFNFLRNSGKMNICKDESKKESSKSDSPKSESSKRDSPKRDSPKRKSSKSDSPKHKSKRGKKNRKESPKGVAGAEHFFI